MKTPFNILDHTDSYLVKNKPHLWLTRLHIITPIAALLLIVTFLLSGWLPLHTSIYPVLVITSLISIAILVFLLRFQFLYYSKNFKAMQLSHIFLINTLNIFILLIVAVIIPLRISFRVNEVLNGDSFSDVSDEIRIAMIPARWIDLIKSGALDSGGTKLFKNLEEQSDFMGNIQNNKFITSALTELNLGGADSTKMSADSSAAIDSSKILPADTTIRKITDTAYLKHYNYSKFLLTLRQKSNSDIIAIKADFQNVLIRYDFSSYPGVLLGDSSVSTENDYFDTLNKQILNLYSTNNFAKNAASILPILFIFGIALAQFSIMHFNKNNNIQLFAAVGTYLCLIAVFVVAVILSNDDPKLLNTFLILLVCVVLPTVLITSKIFLKRPRYKKVNAYAFYTLNFLTLYLAFFIAIIVYVLLFYLFILLFGLGRHAPQLGYTLDRIEITFSEGRYYAMILPLGILIFLLYKVYSLMIKRIHWISNLPNAQK